jgi:hypothetical protein
VLAELTGDDALVTTVEIDPVLVQKAQDNLQFIGKTGVHVLEADASVNPPELAGVQFDRVLLSASVKTPPEWIVRSLRSGGMVIFPLEMLVTRTGWPCFLAKLQKKTDALRGNLLMSSMQNWESLRQTLNMPKADELAPLTWDATEIGEIFQSVPNYPLPAHLGTRERQGGFAIYLLCNIEAAIQSGKVQTVADCRSWLDADHFQGIWDDWLNKDGPGPESFTLCMTDQPESEHLHTKQTLWTRKAGGQALSLLV